MMPSESELDRLTWWACPEWKEARHSGRLALAGDLPKNTAMIGISGNRMQRDGFIKDDPALGCKNRNPDGSVSYCCTFAVVAVINEG